MISPRDALRSYRRAFRRAYKPYPTLPPTHPLMVEMGRRGDRLQESSLRGDWIEKRPLPVAVEIIHAMTSRDLEELGGD